MDQTHGEKSRCGTEAESGGGGVEMSGIIYIVSWLLISYVPVFNNQKIDDYGVITHQYTDGLNYQKKTEFHQKEFTSREEAIRFMENAPKPVPFEYFNHAYAEDIKLDSLDAWLDYPVSRRGR